jgi:transketolase
MSQLSALKTCGQQFWLDNLSRTLLQGEITQMVEQDSLAGITSNPSIFQKSISSTDLYDDRIIEGMADGKGVEAIYQDIAVEDVTMACDQLEPVYQSTQGRDGFVSLEVLPYLAYDTAATITQAEELWQRVNRPNLYIKVPGTKAGIPAIEELIYRGINVNVTLLFSLKSYWETFQAYMRALERRIAAGSDVATVSSVASFFLSRIDVAVDECLQEMAAQNAQVRRVEKWLGKAAVANAKLVYASFQALLLSDRWRRLAQAGAKPQRIVWASTGTKNPDYSDVMYIEPLIGEETISTIPDDTADAFRDHGKVDSTIELDVTGAHQVMDSLQRAGIAFNQVTDRLLVEGVDKFIHAYDQLLEDLTHKRATLEQTTTELGPLQELADRLRVDTIRMTTAAGSGHPTSSVSSAEIMAALFFSEMRWDPTNPQAREVDRFILSKGHAAPILWAALHEVGAMADNLESLRSIDSRLEGHPTTINPWVSVATGSLGQGLAAANGMALANRLDGIPGRVFCLMGDGECSEGSVWEAAQFTAEHRLGGLTAIVDVNGLQQSGPSPSGRDTAVLAGRFRAFGWQTLEVDGHDLKAVLEALRQARENGPTAILARTVKGKGISFAEGKPGWHGKALSEQECERAIAELGSPRNRLQVENRRVPRYRRPATAVKPDLQIHFEKGDEMATRSAFGLALQRLGEAMPDLVVLDGDVKNSTKTDRFAERFPDRFFEANIAEQNMIGAALGLAVSGKLPVAATFAAFLTRAYDFIRMAGHTRPPHLLICGSHAGVSIGADGSSQMGLEDLAMFRAIDGCKILYPCDAISAMRLTELGVATEGIVYLRTTRGKTPVIYGQDDRFEVGGSKTLISSNQDQLTLVAAGITVHTALKAQRELASRGVQARVIDAYSVEPLDVATLDKAARETGNLLVIEDHHLYGGLGDAVSAQVGRRARVFRMSVTGEPHSGTPGELFELHRLSSDSVVQEALSLAA